MTSAYLTATGYPRRYDPRRPARRLADGPPGSALRDLRIAADVSVVDLAAELGCTRTNLYIHESQDRVPAWIARRHEAGIAAIVAKRAAR